MKLWRSAVLVWLLCFSLQTGVMSAAFVHLHADSGHGADHHDGRQVHRHAPGGHDHDSEPDSGDGDSSPSLSPVAGFDLRRIDGPHDAPTHALAEELTVPVPAPTSGAASRPAGAESPPEDPGLLTSSPRGPPRS